jgi:hypothetical protein
VAGIIVVTPENRDRPWLLFEAGALAMSLHSRNGIAAPLAINLRASDIEDPISQLNITQFTRDEMLKLITAINDRMVMPVKPNDLKGRL